MKDKIKKVSVLSLSIIGVCVAMLAIWFVAYMMLVNKNENYHSAAKDITFISEQEEHLRQIRGKLREYEEEIFQINTFFLSEQDIVKFIEQIETFSADFAGVEKRGMRIDGVTKGKPAEKGGMKKGDIITAIEGKKVGNIYEYMNRLKTLEAGQMITVDVLRDDKPTVLIIQL